MTVYKGNAGNLMQHWTLCELVNIADKQHVPGLSFLDAHAMAPYAHTRTESRDDRRRRFDSVLAGLPGKQSVYEHAWYQLVRDVDYPNDVGYPNSVAFVNQVWTRDFSVLLCEKDPATVTALNDWLPSVQGQPKCKRAKVFVGDWRTRFARDLPSPSDVGLPEGSLTLISFDPNMYDRHGLPRNPKPENMYPCDLRVVADALNGIDGAAILQLSTYSANNANSQTQVLASVNAVLTGKGFDLAAQVVLDGNMMSLVYQRGIDWACKLKTLQARFRKWIPYSL